jgi:molybdopterin biosynthesis enzyme
MEFREAKPNRRGFDRLTPLEDAREALLGICQPTASMEKPVEQAVGSIAAKTIISPAPLPSAAIALRDGFAVRALETIGASTYTPAFAVSPPQWIAAGDSIPLSADAILPAHAVQEKMVPIEILAQAAPGEGVRFQGDDFRANTVIVAVGERIQPIHAALLFACGMNTINVRAPRVAFLIRNDLPHADLTGQCLFQLAKTFGASAEIVAIDMSDVAVFSETLAHIDTDLIVSIGGTGFGDTDHAAEALQSAGSLLVHGLAIRPGETGGCGSVAGASRPIPVILVPGRLEAAFAIWVSLVRPCLCEMMAIALQKPTDPLPLARKITSNPGVADIVLLRRASIDAKTYWEPVATGDLPWHALMRAEAWHIVPPESEGYPAGALLTAEEI